MKQPPTYEWADIYPELVNKIRWAVQTTLSTSAYKYPFPEAQAVATVLAQDVVELHKLSATEKDVLSGTGTIRGFFTQRAVDKIVT